MVTHSPDSPLLSGIGDLEDEQQQQAQHISDGPEDEQQHQAHRNPATSLSALFNISTSIVGAGIMGLPATMRIVGLVPGFLLIIFVALLTDKSMDFLLKHTKAARAGTYGGVMRHSFGHRGCLAAQLCIIINSFGTLVVYLIIIADVLSGSTSVSVHHTGVLEKWAGGGTWWNGRFAVMLFAVFALSPLLTLPCIGSLEVPSAVSVLLAVLFVLVTATVAIWKLVVGDIGWPRLLPSFDHSNVTIWTCFSVVPVVVTAFLCQHCAHPILADLERTSNPHAVVQYALVLCTAIYLCTSLFAYLLFGDNTLKDVLSNFDVDLGVPYISDIVRVGYVIHLMLVFPLLHFSLRLNLDGLLFPQAEALDNHRRRFYLLTACAMFLCLLSAWLIPSIWDVFEITGSTSAIGLCYIFPAMLELGDADGTRNRRTAWFMIGVGAVSCFITLSSVLMGFLLSL